MSGTMGPMMPPGGAPQMGGGGQPQIPPQVLQMLMQRMAQQKAMQAQGGMPGGGGPMGSPGPMTGGPPQMPPPGAGMPAAPAGAAGGAPGGPPPTGPTPMGAPPGGAMPPGQQHMTPAQMAQKGRFGDQIVAHLTPGEVQVPPQVQTPQLMDDLRRAFAHFGVNQQQFTAGSPASTNPNTGAPEYSLLGALLPVLGAVGGSFIAPGIGTAIGGGLGGAAGAAMDHQTPAGIALSGLGGGLGGYLGSAGGAAGAADAGVSGAASTSPFGTGALNDAFSATTPEAAAANAGMMPIPPIPPDGGAAAMGQAATAALPQSFGQQLMANAKPGMAAGLGSALGGMLAPPPQQGNGLPPGFNNPMPALNPNFNQLNGSGNASRPGFAGYNPYSAATGGGGYNFYSPQGNGT